MHARLLVVAPMWLALALAGTAQAEGKRCAYPATFDGLANNTPPGEFLHEPGIQRAWELVRRPALAGPPTRIVRAEQWAGGRGWSMRAYPKEAPLSLQLQAVDMAGAEEGCPLARRVVLRYEVRRVPADTCPAANAASERLQHALKEEMDHWLQDAGWLGRPASPGLDRIRVDGTGYTLQFYDGYRIGIALAYDTDDEVLAEASDALIDAVAACAAQVTPIRRETRP